MENRVRITKDILPHCLGCGTIQTAIYKSFSVNRAKRYVDGEGKCAGKNKKRVGRSARIQGLSSDVKPFN